MIFLYSRKVQLVLLLCWFAGMTAMYVQITGERPFWLVKAFELTAERGRQKARLGQAPELPAPVQQPAPAPVARPAPDPKLNRCLALRVSQGAGEDTDTLILELDYVAARTKGFKIDAARSYYLKDVPVFVVELGRPWISDIGDASFPIDMPQAVGVELIVFKSGYLRLLVRTKAMHIASAGKLLRVAPTDTGLRAEVEFPR
jgi:hypothetical protein